MYLDNNESTVVEACRICQRPSVYYAVSKREKEFRYTERIATDYRGGRSAIDDHTGKGV